MFNEIFDMKYFILLFLKLTFLYTNSFAQNKQDYIWLWGVDRLPAPGIQGYKFDFNIKPFSITSTNIGVEFGNNNASICDKDGNLLFYTNGCAVLNKEANIMPNGDSINYDIWWDLTGRNNCEKLGYPGTQNSIILNDPGNNDEYFLLHKPYIFEDWENYNQHYLWYSKIDMSLDNGLGDVIEKNQVLYDERQSLSSYLTAINHANGKEWWIIQPLLEDSLFIIFLLTENGFERKEDQNTRQYFNLYRSGASGTSNFSPDGTKYALYNYNDQLHIYDFNRETGKLTNHKKVLIYPEDSIDVEDIRFSSVEWSSNSRFIYTASRDELHQIDTWEEDLQDGVRLIDTYDGTQNPFPNTFYLMALGPDCRIYMCSTNGNKTYHVINHPNRLGKACDFVQNGIKLPYEAGVGSMPNFPRFRVDEEDKCDSTIVSVFGDYVYYRRDLEVYPNPSDGIFNVKIPDRLGKSTLVVINIYGQIIKKLEISGIFKEKQIDITGMPTGRYNIDVYPEKNPDRIVYSRQVVVVE